ncbi:MAG TPA: bifunctional riboflavin kinase/FAD synthetase, partial [Usitatibacter sp.]|nr:bifunctional riboflavin kinase/FAD synthetase [Usitatibacter sp.]
MRIVRHPGPAQRDTTLAIGSFDGVHRGHAAIVGRVVAEARSRGIASAVLTFEPLPREFFAPADAPARLTTLAERAAVLAGLGLDTAFVQRFDARFAGLAPDEFAA